MFQLHRYLFSAVVACIAATLLLSPQNSSAATLADSQLDWSSGGVQGENDWSYGWRNYTVDGGAAYDHLADFIPFVNDGTNAGPDYINNTTANNWTGSEWRLQSDPGATGGPWTFLNSLTAHPNGTNSQPTEEHWVIRRWTAPATLTSQTLELRSFLGAQNVNGPGTSVHLYQNGNLLDTISTAAAAGVTNSVYHTINAGDIIDLALSPEDAAGDRSDGSDGSNFSLVITDEQPPIPPVADSLLDWSTTGTAGENGWTNGYYNSTVDGGDGYQTSDFRPFLNDGSGVPETDPAEVNHWNGSAFDFEGNPPWTELSAGGTHPNGDNNGEVHSTVRRFVASGLSGTTPLALNWTMAKTNTGGGNGVTGRLFVNGSEVDSSTIAGGDGIGVDRTYYINAANGDVIDLHLSPEGVDGTLNDGSDGSANRLVLSDQIPDDVRQPSEPDTVLVDAGAEFSGVQGQDGWEYGYYDITADSEIDPILGNPGDGIYGNEPEDFTPFAGGSDSAEVFGPTNHWDGDNWEYVGPGGETNPPWTQISAGSMHPQDDDPAPGHYAIRRFNVGPDEAGDVNLTGFFNNASANGDGTFGRIFINGTELLSLLTDGTTETFDEAVTLAEGDVIDIVVDWGPGADGADNTLYGFQIVQPGALGDLFEPIPEPASGLTALVALGLLGLARRRRR